MPFASRKEKPRRGEPGGKFGNDVERADQVDGHGLGERVERMGRILLPHRLDRRCDPRTIDQDAGDAMRCFCGIQSCRDAGVIGDIDPDIDAAQFRGDCLARFLIQVEDRNLGPLRCQHRRRRLAKARSSAGNDGWQTIDIHNYTPCYQASSIAIAVASPPPMHRLATPRFSPRVSSAPISVATMRAPDAPIG